MISAFVLCKFESGIKLSDKDLQNITEFGHHKHCPYSDKSAAMYERGTSAKQPLDSSSFVMEFEYGDTAQGYWTYDHMVLQLRYCVDMVKVLYHNYEYIFLFNQSCGRDSKIPDDLCGNSIRKTF
jgi:hypothetical protein